jgi:murein DD-endopeptidase MepM/ murein hydrolase activator NlpD
MSYLDLDFKSARPTQPSSHYKSRRSPRFRLNRLIRGASALVTLVGATLLAISFLPDSLAKVEDSNLKTQRLHYSVDLPHYQDEFGTENSALPEQAEHPAPQSNDQWTEVRIKAGNTLASIFSEAGLNATITHEVVNLNDQTKQLSNIKPGQTIKLLVNAEQQLNGLEYQPDITRTLVVKRQQDGSLKSELQHHPLEPIPVYKSGTIKTSLFEAAAENDIPEKIIMELAGIFGWDIDFVLDIRAGDRFSVVYNQLYRDGVRIRDGRILAAEFVNQGKTFQAVYYTDPKDNNGYFSPDGKSMRKAFLRSPVKFSHISSRFTPKRWHPVLSKWRSHKGVDYAAARGTPVRAAGDGKVKFRGTKGGYGKTIILQHGGRYTTVYAHLSRYAGGLKNGKRIKQGQVIGYVGSTGLATGPHLHYEFRVNGVHRNPLTVKLPAAEPINKAYREHFQKQTKSHLTMLNLMNDQAIAQTTSDDGPQQN